MNRFANYHVERMAFRALFSVDCAARILLLRGATGSGKTALLTTCQAESGANDNLIGIQLRGTAVNVAEIFSRSAGRIGWQNLKNFEHCTKQLMGQSAKVLLSGVQQTGQSNSLHVALNVGDAADREYRQTLLTDAWFSDLVTLGRSITMVFDTYEQAPTEVKNWISGPLLGRVAEQQVLRVAIAGQSVPSPSIEWSSCHRLHELKGVNAAGEWLSVVQSLGKHIPSTNALAWLSGICHAFNGKPSDIMKVIEALPAESAVEAQQMVAS